MNDNLWIMICNLIIMIGNLVYLELKTYNNIKSVTNTATV